MRPFLKLAFSIAWAFLENQDEHCMRQFQIKYQILYMVMMFLLSSCSFSTENLAPTTQIITPTEIPTIQPTLSDSEWQQLAPGLEQRAYTPDDNPLAQLIVLRIDPNLYTFRAHYRAGAPLGVSEWEATLGDAIALVNANFFDPQNRVLGLLVSDGEVYGSSYVGRGGTFIVQNGQARVRSNSG